MGGDPEHIPNYSTDDTESLKVLMWMRKSSKFCCIKVNSEYHYWWDIDVYYSDLTLSLKDIDHVNLFSASSSSFALGICSAFLIATEEMEKRNRVESKAKDTSHRS